MGDYTQSVNALRAALVAGFTSLPAFWPNDPRDPLEHGGRDGWLLAEAELIAESPESIGQDGNRWHRDVGAFTVYIYVPSGSLIGTAENYAQQIRQLFGLSSQLAAGVYITSRRIGRAERVEGPTGKWYCVPVYITWFADRIE